MSKAEIQIGANTQQAVDGIAKLRGEQKRWRDEAKQSMAASSTVGKGFGNRATIIAQQAQDIAVQLQMGTKLTTVIAQQGSQLASVIGPNGAILGGAIAIGGALAMVGDNANKAFDEMITGAKEFGGELEKLAVSGSVDQLVEGLEKAKKLGGELGQKSIGGGGVMDVVKGGLGVLMGGDSLAEQQGKALITQGQLYWSQIKARQQLLKLAEQDLEIEEMKAAGMDRQADQLKRNHDLEKAIAKIKSSSLDEEAKKRLIAAETGKKEANDRKAAADSQKKINDGQSEAEERHKKNALAAFDKSIDERLKPASQRSREASESRRRARAERSALERDAAKNIPGWNNMRGVDRQEIIRRRIGAIAKERESAEAVILKDIKASIKELVGRVATTGGR